MDLPIVMKTTRTNKYKQTFCISRLSEASLHLRFIGFKFIVNIVSKILQAQASCADFLSLNIMKFAKSLFSFLDDSFFLLLVLIHTSTMHIIMQC